MIDRYRSLLSTTSYLENRLFLVMPIFRLPLKSSISDFFFFFETLYNYNLFQQLQ